MRAKDFINEGLNHPCIVVDVQPEYSGMMDGDENSLFPEIIQFVEKQRGPVLMFVNAERDGLTGDTVHDVQRYWEDTIGYNDDDYDDANYSGPIDWSRYTVVDKGYGYFRSWMDEGVSDATIIRTIRTMYQAKVSDIRELFGGEESDTYEPGMEKLMGPDYHFSHINNGFSVKWTSVAQLKRFSGSYIMGGGRDECLREVELLMNAFNIKYKRIDSLVY